MNYVNNEQKNPIPEPTRNNINEEISEITAESIQEEIVGLNEDGYSRSAIIAIIEKIHNVLKNPEAVTDEDHEYIKQIDVEYCKVDMFSISDSIINLVLTFDSTEDAFLHDLIDSLNYYRNLVEKANELSYEDDNTPLPMLTFTFAPYKFKGMGVAIFTHPIAFFKTLNDDGKECCVHLLFNNEDAHFQKVDISDEALTEIQADIMRERELQETATYHSSY